LVVFEFEMDLRKKWGECGVIWIKEKIVWNEENWDKSL